MFDMLRPLGKKDKKIRKIFPLRAVLVSAILGALSAAVCSPAFADSSAVQSRRTLEIQERTYGADSVQVADALHNLAEVLKAQGDYAEAERLYWRSVMIRSYLMGAAHAALWPTLKRLAEINQALGRPGEAEKLYSRASAIAEKTLPAFSRARLYEFSVGDSEAAATARGSSVSLMLMPGTTLSEREVLQATERPEIAVQLEGLAEIYRAQGRLIDAIDVMRRVLSIRERAFGPSHPEVARSYGVISSLLAAQRGAPAPGARSAQDSALPPASPR
jgi:tetratricopeptide (TPR) repeat protein